MAHFSVGQKFRNLILLLFSLGFYAWGEGSYVLVMLYAIVTSWVFGMLLDKVKRQSTRKGLLWVAVILNLLPLLYFKYSTFLAQNLYSLFGVDAAQSFLSRDVSLPIGISFFTFQSLSYLIDVYRHQTPGQKSLFDLGLFISLFPQLIAGPIVRYHDISDQLQNRSASLTNFTLGTERFIYGLGKKVLIANPLGEVADMVFALPEGQLGMASAWLGVTCYALQIYFDFSGYSDMAIGLGRMFGFRFLENFNYPYISRSIREFWRRWHISLSRWFRDYLYIPLGGNRCSELRVSINLMLVFLLCGFWHGASWNFVIWGLFHGVFLSLERGRLASILNKLPAAGQHVYVMLVVLFGWVLFRANDLSHSLVFFKAMFGFEDAVSLSPLVALQLDQRFYFTLLLALVFCMPVFGQLRNLMADITEVGTDSFTSVMAISAKHVLIIGILVAAVFEIALGSYNPFIYFRF
ncbi:MAG: MBOAT family O-acyltransferase [bacterium]